MKALAGFLEVGAGAEQPTWYRGQADAGWPLWPKAFRYTSKRKREKALDLFHEFKRQALTKMPTVPQRGDDVEWLGIAQHYGLPTRLLDWTTNPVIALYFACWQEPKTCGSVYMMQPADLNRFASAREGPIRGGVYDAQVNEDRALIQRYISGEETNGCIALNPAYDTTRILLQRGTFTLHADNVEITKVQAPSLTAVPIPARRKTPVLAELTAIGIDEMSIFPELEHMCSHLGKQV